MRPSCPSTRFFFVKGQEHLQQETVLRPSDALAQATGDSQEKGTTVMIRLL